MYSQSRFSGLGRAIVISTCRQASRLVMGGRGRNFREEQAGETPTCRTAGTAVLRPSTVTRGSNHFCTAIPPMKQSRQARLTKILQLSREGEQRIHRRALAHSACCSTRPELSCVLLGRRVVLSVINAHVTGPLIVRDADGDRPRAASSLAISGGKVYLIDATVSGAGTLGSQ